MAVCLVVCPVACFIDSPLSTPDPPMLLDPLFSPLLRVVVVVVVVSILHYQAISAYSPERCGAE